MCFKKKSKGEFVVEREDLEYEVGKMIARQKKYLVFKDKVLFVIDHTDMKVSKESAVDVVSRVTEDFPYGVPVVTNKQFDECPLPYIDESVGFANNFKVRGNFIVADITVDPERCDKDYFKRIKEETSVATLAWQDDSAKYDEDKDIVYMRNIICVILDLTDWYTERFNK